MIYTLQDAAMICINLEPVLAKHGFHVAIGGSLAYRGTSGKDIDIIIYPHSREVKMDRFILIGLLEVEGYEPVRFNPEEATCVPDVLPTKNDKGQRVDFFFMERSNPFPTNPAQ